MIEEQISGLRSRIGQLRQTERIMLEASGLRKQIASETQKADELRTALEAAKTIHQAAKDAHTQILSEATASLMDRLNKHLPEGKAYLELDEGSVNLGWIINGVPRPFRSLSGGERVAFDMAIAYALDAGLIIKELAELDSMRLGLVLEQFCNVQAQVICISCHEPKTIPEGFSVLRQTPQFASR
jgi:DNA repair exonuclease SbcCD ATPase subunit